MQAQQLKLENGMRQLMQVFPRAKVKFAWKGVDSTMDLAEMKPDEVRSTAQRSPVFSLCCSHTLLRGVGNSSHKPAGPWGSPLRCCLQIMVVTHVSVSGDSNWWRGYVASDPGRHGMFPSTHVELFGHLK